MITIESNGTSIELFGRHSNKQLYSKKDETFKAYFYVESTFGTFNTIDGKKVRRINVNSFKDLKTEVEKYENHYEGDVKPVNRYIIDRIPKLEREPIRICYLDIEVEQGEGYSEAKDANNAITVIGVHDNFEDKTQLFALKAYENEVAMLNAFIDYIQSTDPDIITAWFGDGYDFPYLINRLKNLKIDFKRLGRNGGYSYTFGERIHLYGRILFDMLEAYKYMNQGAGRESWGLDYISKYELGKLGGKEEYEGSLDELYEKDYEKFIKYNERDVELLVLLDNKLKIIDFFDEVRRMAFCKFEDVFYTTKVIDGLCFKYAQKEGFILPSIKRRPKDKYEGSYVVLPEPKIYENIVVMDFKSLYPSVMIGFNTSYETVDDNGEIKIDKYHFKKEPGMIPILVKSLLDRREEIKKEMKKIADGRTQEYKTLNLMQKAVKVLANAMYGALGFQNFRLYKREVASAITYISQKTLKETIRWFNEKGYKVIYGDTDSIFIQFETNDIKKIEEINVEVNKHMNEWVKNFGIERKEVFTLEFEEIFKVLLFKQKDDGTGAKKKYAGRLYWKDGIYTNEVMVVGFESKKSDLPQIARDFLNKILEMILDKESPEEIYKYVQNFKDKIKNKEYTPEQLGIPMSINKPINSYTGNVMHIRASKLANERHKEGIRSGDKVKVIFVQPKEPKLNGQDNVIAFKTKMPKGYELDYDRIINRLVDLKAEPMFRSLGWEYQLEKPKKLKREKDTIYQRRLI